MTLSGGSKTEMAAGRCRECGKAKRPLYYSCCGDPVDGSSGTGCRHTDGHPTCGPCGARQGWWPDLEE